MPQYLRVRRRRNAATSMMLRLEGLLEGRKRNREVSEQMEELALQYDTTANSETTTDDIITSGTTTTQRNGGNDLAGSNKKLRTAVWRKVDDWTLLTAHANNNNSNNANNIGIPGCKKNVRVIDAVLEDAVSLDDDDNDDQQHQHLETKRRRTSRRLTLLNTTNTTSSVSTSASTVVSGTANKAPTALASGTTTANANASKRKTLRGLRTGAATAGGGSVGTASTGYKILHPLERLVDTSLQQVAKGTTKTPAQHWEWCRNDPILLDDRLKWYKWSNTELGNILHVCSLWNDAETTASVLTHLQHYPADVMEYVTLALDGDGRTPYQVAQVLSHTEVCQVLEAFGADQDFVFDVYRLEEDDEPVHCSSTTAMENTCNESGHLPTSNHGTDANNNNKEEIDPSTITTCELQGGVGYYNETGELVLEVLDGISTVGVDESSSRNGDDDDDSNSEGWEGNDYPDDDDNDCQDDDDDYNDQIQNDNDDDDDDEIDDCPDGTFRHYKVQF